MRKWLILLSVLFVTPASVAPVWTWVDDQGQVHYSDRPVPGATEIDLQGAQTFGARSRAAARPVQTTRPQATASRYTTFNIVTPVEQETLWNIGGNLNVRLQLSPPLLSDHRADLVLDGQRMNLNVRSTEFTVPNVFRGTHSAQAVIVDSNDREVARSPAVSFVVQQTSIQNPNSPQGQRNRANQSAN